MAFALGERSLSRNLALKYLIAQTYSLFLLEHKEVTIKIVEFVSKTLAKMSNMVII